MIVNADVYKMLSSLNKISNNMHPDEEVLLKETTMGLDRIWWESFGWDFESFESKRIGMTTIHKKKIINTGKTHICSNGNLG